VSVDGWYHLRAVDFRKTYYILPNLFTLSNVFSGFVSISLTTSGEGGTSLYLAALAICFGFFFDTFDGRVARLTKTQTELGRDLDSLSDLITFGAAPALLVYKWGLSSFGRLGIFIAGLFVCAGAMRLARFNVLSRREEANGQKNPGKYTLGLSIPAAASVVVFMVLISHGVEMYRTASQAAVAVLVVVLSYLMVSRIRFRSFKDIRPTKKTVGVVLLVAGVWIVMRMNRVHDAFIFLALIAAYIALGLTEEIIFLRRRLAERQAEKSGQVVPPPTDQPRDEEVLAELGAFDRTDDDGDDDSDDAARRSAAAGTVEAPKRA
jgi:CDP-diacylglycerol--serine O-phosphatidyltransferase